MQPYRGWVSLRFSPTPQVSLNLTRRVWRKSAHWLNRGGEWLTLSDLTCEARSLILLKNLEEPSEDGRDYRVITRRCCCRPTGAGGVGGPPPNSRSKNDGPEGPLPKSLLKATLEGRDAPLGRT